MPEVIFGEGNSEPDRGHLCAAGETQRQRARHPRRAKPSSTRYAKKSKRAEYRPLARAIVLERDHTQYGKGTIAVVSAGTSDIPVAEEAVVTASSWGTMWNISTTSVLPAFIGFCEPRHAEQARVVIVCAGMEGALPSVVGGL